MARKYTSKKKAYKPRKKAGSRSRPKPKSKARKLPSKAKCAAYINTVMELRSDVKSEE